MPFDGLFSKKHTTIEPITIDSFRGENKPFLIACFGAGRDSVGGIIALAQLGIRPEIIVMADTGAEKDSTYAYLPIFNAYLRSIGFPEITVVGLGRKRDSDFEAHLFRLGIFASLSYGRHACSSIWKINAIDRYLSTHRAVVEAKRQGRQMVRAVFFEAGEEYRARRSDKNAIGATTDANGCRRATAFTINAGSDYIAWFPLIELGLSLNEIVDLIWREGLRLPKKSSCYFCAAMTELEIYQLSQDEPHKFFRGLVLERVVQRNPVVIHDRRVQGLKFGKCWTDYECADPYVERLDEVVEFFGLDRAVCDGEKNTKSVGWMKKAARVELFRKCFGSVENLRAFMNRELDMTFYAEKIAAINAVEHDPQMALPL